MKHDTELLIDENNIELLVGYDYEEEQGYYAEKNNPGTWVEPTIEVELTSVELILGGEGIFDALPFMNEIQKQFIISKLTYGKS